MHLPKEYSAPRGHFYAVTDVRILRTGAPKLQMMALKLWHIWTCKGPDVPRLIAEWGLKKQIISMRNGQGRA